jgi:hypothetical protein
VQVVCKWCASGVQVVCKWCASGVAPSTRRTKVMRPQRVRRVCSVNQVVAVSKSVVVGCGGRHPRNGVARAEMRRRWHAIILW